jgi:hypothetical protein
LGGATSTEEDILPPEEHQRRRNQALRHVLEEWNGPLLAKTEYAQKIHSIHDNEVRALGEGIRGPVQEALNVALPLPTGDVDRAKEQVAEAFRDCVLPRLTRAAKVSVHLGTLMVTPSTEEQPGGAKKVTPPPTRPNAKYPGTVPSLHP